MRVRNSLGGQTSWRLRAHSCRASLAAIVRSARGKSVSSSIAANSNTGRSLAILGVLLAGGLLVPAHVFAAIPPASHTANDPNAGGAVLRKLLADAQKALAAGNVRLAVIYLKNAVSVAPRNAAARVQLGAALLRLGDQEGAERELRQARRDGAPPLLVLPPLFQAMLTRNEDQMLLDLFPDPGPTTRAPEAPDILNARALAFQKLQRGHEAIDAMNRSLELRRDAPGLLTRARLSLVQGDYEAAGRFVDEAIQNWPENTDAMLLKVELLLASKNNASALALANQINSRYPGSLAGRFARVETYLRLNQDAQARAEIDSILAKNPDLLMAIYYKALLMARAGDFKGAWGIAQALPANFLDSNEGIAASVAQIAISAGKTEMGASMLARMLKDHPDQLAARIRLAQLRLRHDGTASALNILGPVMDSTDPRVTRLLAVIYLQTHRVKDALYALRQLNAEHAATPVEVRALALLEVQSGNADQAIDALSPAVGREPGNAIVVEPYINILLQKRRFGEALKVADKYGSDPKHRVQALVYRGTILVMQGNAAGARAALDKAVAIDPRSKSALFARATLLTANQKYADASRDLKTILSLDAKNVAAVMKLAEIAGRQGDDAGVRALYGQAIALSPRSAAPRIALALYFVSRQDMKGALAVAQECVLSQPNNDECELILGRTQSILGQKKEAVATFRRLTILRPDLASAQLLLSAALSLAGDRASAARALDAAVELDPEGEAVRGAQIDFQFGSGNAGAAVGLARDFQSSHPGTAADLMLAQSLERAKRSDEAAAVLSKGLSERPNSLVLMRLVHLAQLSNDPKRAGDLMSKWLARKPDDTAVRMKYAAVLLQQDETVKAISQYQIIVNQAPDNIDALNNLAWLIQSSDPKRAQSLLARALRLSPNSSHVADTLGWLKINQKDFSGGLVLINRAHSLQPDNPTITYHLIVALDANAKRDDARRLLKSLLASGAQFRERSAALQLSSAWD